MKKSILTAVLMAAISMTASAVSITWQSAVLNYGGTALKNNSGVTGYLLYLADGELQSSYTVADSFAPASVGQVVSSLSGTPKTGRVKNDLVFDFGTYENGDAFALLVSYVNPDDSKTYWNLSSTVNTISELQNESSLPKFTDFLFNADMGTDPTLSAGGGWVTLSAGSGGGDDPVGPAVPEPATGMLAIAGLALLFRRKRA